MRISIAVPSYQQADYLDRTLASLLAQQGCELEVLVMDGGSTDGSVKIIERHAGRLAYWRSYPDDGQTAAIAEGFDNATGDVLGWLNSDDLLLPGALARVAALFQSEPRTDWVIGGSHVIDSCDAVLSRRFIIDDLCLSDLLDGYYRLPQESIFYRRDLYNAVGGLDTSLHLAMDFDLWVRMMLHSPPRIIHQALAAYRIQPDQKTADIAAYDDEVRAVAARYKRRLSPAQLGSSYSRLLAQATLPARRLRAKLRADGLANTVRWTIKRRTLGRA